MYGRVGPRSPGDRTTHTNTRPVERPDGRSASGAGLTLFTAWLLVFGPATGAAAEPGITWDSLPERAAQRFEALQKATASEQAGLAHAETLVAGPWETLWLTAEPGVGIVGRDDGAADSFVGVGASVALSDLSGLRRTQLRAQSGALQAHRTASAFGFVVSTSQRWLQWVRLEVLAQHLAEDVAEFEARLKPFSEAATQRRITKLDQADLRAELARLRSELIQTRAEADGQAAALEALLGAPPVVVDPDRWVTPKTGDPWGPVASNVAAHPGLTAHRADARAARADAAGADANPLRLDFGLLAHLDEGGFFWAAPTITLHIPLDNPGAADAAVARGRAEAAEIRQTIAQNTLQRELTARQRQHAALVRRLTGLGDALIAPLEARLSMVEAALASGATSGLRLVDAWRDLHEARHARLDAALALSADNAEAQRLNQLLSRPLTPGDHR